MTNNITNTNQETTLKTNGITQVTDNIRMTVGHLGISIWQKNNWETWNDKFVKEGVSFSKTTLSIEEFDLIVKAVRKETHQ